MTELIYFIVNCEFTKNQLYPLISLLICVVFLPFQFKAKAPDSQGNIQTQ